MSENNTTFTYSERQYMLRMLTFLDSLVIKSTYDAELTETKESRAAGELYVLAKNKKDTIFNYELSVSTLREVGVNTNMIALFMTDKSQFYTSLPKDIEDRIVEKYRQDVIFNYKETNGYYRTLNGEPANDSEIILIEDTFDGGIFPIHMYSETFHTKMYAYLMNYNKVEFQKILDAEIAKGRNYEYFNYILRKTSYHIARAAKNFEILYSDSSTVSPRDVHNFFVSYYNALDYVQTVPYIKDYSKSEELYDRYMGVVILFIALLNFIVNRIDVYLRNEFTTTEEIRRFFAEFRMESVVDELSDQQLKVLMVNIDDLIALKGNDEVILKVLKLFEIDNINIYKYMLLKYVKSDSTTKEIVYDPKKTRAENYDLTLVKIPIEDVENAMSLSKYLSDKDRHTPLKTIALKDKFFGGTKYSTSDSASNPKHEFIKGIEDDLKNKEEFSYFYTKYLGILTHVNISQSIVEATYLFNTIMRDNESLDKLLQMSSIARSVTPRDLFCAINYITTLRSGMSDDIILNASGIASLMAFNTDPSLEELKQMSSFVVPSTDDGGGEVVDVKLPEILSEDDIFIVKRPTLMENEAEYDNDNNSIRSYEYNMTAHDELLEKMYATSDYHTYVGYQRIFSYNMYCKSMHDIFRGVTNYTTYLDMYCPELLEYITTAINTRTDNIWETNEGEYTDSFREACIDLVSEFIDAILTGFDIPATLQNAVGEVYKDNTSVFSKIFTIINIFKSYTTTFANADSVYTINSKRDCLVKLVYMLSNEHGTDGMNEALSEYIRHYFEMTASTNGTSNLGVRDLLSQYFRTDITNPISIIGMVDIMIPNERIEEPVTIRSQFQTNEVVEQADSLKIGDVLETLE